ncbi:alpha/beta hydrolase [Advenella sp. FME57]|uniref:PHA/PHB synthase family protein n=1 Tax=Advenella sp. FME57 TaxID=2742604 RepID=UPI001868B7EE|nr:alpha/beta fold hydrolase [Advenella sp. FME57]
MKKIDQELIQPGSSDAIVHEKLVPFTHGIAAASIVGAYLDWISHVAASPDKQRDMSEGVLRQLAAWTRYVQELTPNKSVTQNTEQANDKRFTNAAWDQAPYNWSAQAFLLAEQWWLEAMGNVRGVSSHHEDVVKFVTRQWLDMISPSNYLMSNPEVLRYTFSTGGVNLIRGALNWQQDVSNLLLQRKPRGTENFIPGKTVAITPGKVIYANDLIELIQYEPVTAKVYPEPILIVPSWIMKYYILDLSPHNSLVKYLVGQGHTVFMISWKNPQKEDRDLSLNDYLDLGVMSALDEIVKKNPQRKIHGVGYCLGGTLLALVAAALQRQKPDTLATLTLLASQLDFKDPGQLGLFIDESQISYLEILMSNQGYLDGTQMAGAFALINSKDLVWSKLVHEYLMGAQTPMTDLRAWNADATRMPYRMHSEYLRKFYLNNDLAEGRFVVGGKPIALKDLHLPVFCVSTERDHVSPWKSVYKIHWLTDCEVTFVLTSGGHNVGIVNPPQVSGNKKISYRVSSRLVGGEYEDPDKWIVNSEQRNGSWWPQWQLWLASHSSKEVPITAKPKDTKNLVAAPGSYVYIT